MVQFQHVSKAFGRQLVLRDVSFTVQTGERVGIVGPNGAGKSTVFELITETIEPDTGMASVPSSLRIGYVHQQLHPHKSKSTLLEHTENAVPRLRHIETRIHHLEAGLDAMSGQGREACLHELGNLQTDFEHLGGYDLRTRATATLSGLGFDNSSLDLPFSSLSGGWQIRAELARNLVSQPDILLLDEPTNYLDVPAVEWLQDYLREFRGTFLLISHDRYLLNILTNVTLEIVGGRVTRYPGNYNHYFSERQHRYAQLLAAKKNQDRKREQLERFVERFRAKNTKASQAQSRLKMLAKLEEIEVPQAFIKPLTIHLPEPPRSGNEVIQLKEAGFSYDESQLVLEDVDCRIERGDKVAVVGLNGMGKTTLLKILAGRLRLNCGLRKLGHKVKIGYQSQDFTDVMDPASTVFETARGAAVDRSDGDIRALLGGFGFSGDAIEKKVEILSGGEKVRLALARLLLRPVNFIILDEPTTHLDIHAREALEEALKGYAGTLCIVSHDIDFVRHLATTILEVSPMGVRRYYGDYDYYREKLAQERRQQSDHILAATSQPEGQGQQRKAQKREEARQRQAFSRLRKPLEKRIANAEKQAEDLEKEQSEILQELQHPGEGSRIGSLSRRLAEIHKLLKEMTEEWERASLELEGMRERTINE